MSDNKTKGSIAVTFLHPRAGTDFSADIIAETTGQQALDGMIAAKFLEPASAKEAYALQLTRTGKTLPLNASIVGSGAKANDTIAVVSVNAGAGR